MSVTVNADEASIDQENTENLDDIIEDVIEPAAENTPETTLDLELALPEDISEQTAERIKLFRDALNNGDVQLVKAFDEGAGGRSVVRSRARLVDALLIRAWSLFLPDDDPELALVAVGGYGRGELHPGSDVDIQLLVTDASAKAHQSALENFLTFLWDIGLEPGHSVRSIEDCFAQAQADITVMTNLLEARHLLGSAELFSAMLERLGPTELWSSAEFFRAKRDEQQARHKRHQDDSYRLEPNLKESPGGLRDIQMITWVARRYFNHDLLSELIDAEFLNEEEYRVLVTCRSFLWRVRFALHTEAGRGEDRLLFDMQLRLSERLGYQTPERERNQAVEAFMQDYFQCIVRVNRLNEMLLQLFEDRILGGVEGVPVAPINNRFQLRGDFIEVRHDQVFVERPLALLEIFSVLQRHPTARGVSAGTIRLIRQHRDLIDDKFREDLAARSLFMEIMRQPRGITHELRRMNRYGVLARYIPAFRNIVGRMQFDMFHVYTVDEHILMVVRNLRHAACPEYDHELPFISKLTQTAIPKPELLYLAGLFHDIGKGRKGDHSKLGAEDALVFCRDHGLSEHDSGLVSWLVRNHLTMSVTAQRKDINDPEIIHEFASIIGSEVRLNYLFLLTVADIRGTNPELWNDWRSSLLMQLYHAARRVLQRGLENPIAPAELIADRQLDALYRLQQAGLPEHRVQGLWQTLGDDYFLRHTVEEVVWHTQALINHVADEGPLVLLREIPSRGGSTVFIHAPDALNLFGYTAAAINHLGLNIVDARVHSTPDGDALDSYVILELDGSPISDPDRQRDIVHTLRERLARFAEGERSIEQAKRAERRVRAFNVATEITFTPELSGQRTALELTTADRPGLLSQVGQAFDEHQVILHTAKIATIGERTEDVFYITDHNNLPLTDTAKQQALSDRLTELLSESE